MTTRIGVQVSLGAPLLVTLMGARLCAGFPSPADDYVEEALDPARLVVTNPTATFMWRVAGRSMIGAGINDGDYVVVDRSLVPRAGDAVVAVIDGQPSAKRVVAWSAAGWRWTSTIRPCGRLSWTRRRRR